MRFLIDWDSLFDIDAARRLDSMMAGVAAVIATVSFALVAAPTIVAFATQVPQ